MNWYHISKFRSEIMGVACIWVMCFHNICNWQDDFKILHTIIQRGNVGVDIFLLLSGIGLYFSFKNEEHKTMTDRIRGFYKKRFVRLFVPYVLIALPFFAWGAREKGVQYFLLNFFQLNFPLRGINTTWYITATFFFYIIFPLIYFLQEKGVCVAGLELERGSVTIILCMIGFALNLIFQVKAPNVYKNCEIGVSRILVFIIGCGFGKIVKDGKTLSQTAVLGSSVFIIIYIYYFLEQVSLPTLWTRLSYIPFGISATVLFAWFFYKLDCCVKVRTFFRFFGDRSLELYLTHVTIRTLWQTYVRKQIFDKRDILAYICILLIAIIISALIHPLINTISKRLLAINEGERVKMEN